MKKIKNRVRKFQYHIQQGLHPLIHYYAASPFEYKTADKARLAGEHLAEQVGLKHNTYQIHINREDTSIRGRDELGSYR